MLLLKVLQSSSLFSVVHWILLPQTVTRKGNNTTEICVRIRDWFMDIMQYALSISRVAFILLLTLTVIVDLNFLDLLLQRRISMMMAIWLYAVKTDI
jgi:hypothetical protein